MGIDGRSKRQRKDSDGIEQKELNLWQKYGQKVVKPSKGEVEVRRAYYKCHVKDCLARLFHDSQPLTAEHLKTTAISHRCSSQFSQSAEPRTRSTIHAHTLRPLSAFVVYLPLTIISTRYVASLSNSTQCPVFPHILF